ncbi:hypothetical protein CFC21_039324 [Triticum aestivum]|uniref:DUF4378 domain-containing protein n=2 Tax=Triticum aestivum TaxID=4565 RepID=A0A9R1JRS3_WHEAT|nr:hypothetical protein CFC21_039324 [Triticum aestivum]
MLGQPSVIARLMGMEDHHHQHALVPATATTIVQASGRTTTISVLKPSSSQAEQPKCGPLGAHHGRRVGGDYYRYCLNKMKPRRRRARRDRRRREHPQEELLHQIKEGFRASWQLASMASTPLGTEEDTAMADASGRRSGGRVAGLLDGRCIQRIAQENLRREKMARYGYGGRQSSVEGEEGGVKALVVGLKKKNDEESEQRHGGSEVSASDEFSGEHGDHDQMSTTSPEKLRGVPATRIAILRPATGATRGAAGDHGSATPSWKAVRDGGMDMEDFLREVKERAERLKDEMKAKADGPGDAVAKARRGWGSVGDGPERTAHDTARQIREAVGKRLSRLESFRVFRGDRGRRDGSLSPEHRMLRSVMARTEAMSPTKTTGRGSRGSRWSPLRAGAGVNDRQSPDRDPRRSPAKLHDDDGVDFVVASPRALLRSFSAPAAGCSSGASSEGAEKTVGRSRSFSIFRGTVASLRHSLCMGGGAGKLLLTHLSRKKPSSPASPRQNFLSAGPPSPVSPLEVSGGRHFSGDLNCTFLPESSPRWNPRCSSELEASVGGGESPWEWKADAAAESDDPDTAYVREVLVAAGLFVEDDDEAPVARTDSIAISDDVFEEVEDGHYYRRLRYRDDGAGEDEELGAADRRRLLFDLANEALLAGARPAVSSSSPSCLRRWVVECNDGAPSSSRPRGRELEDEVWRHVARATADGTAERDVGRSPWVPEALCGDACAVGRKIERAIFDELVGDVVRQLFV